MPYSIHKKSIEMKEPILLFEIVLLIGGIMLFISRIKMWKKSKSSALISGIVGAILILISLYLLFWTIILGYNSYLAKIPFFKSACKERMK